MGDLIYGIAKVFGLLHPIHPVLVHITIGTVVASLVFAVIGLIWKKTVFHHVARYNANLTLVSVFLTIPMGLVDWLHFYNGASSTTITMKLVLSGTLLAFLFVTFFVNRKHKDGSIVVLVLYIVNFLHVAALGFYGGNLVY